MGRVRGWWDVAGRLVVGEGERRVRVGGGEERLSSSLSRSTLAGLVSAARFAGAAVHGAEQRPVHRLVQPGSSNCSCNSTTAPPYTAIHPPFRRVPLSPPRLCTDRWSIDQKLPHRAILAADPRPDPRLQLAGDISEQDSLHRALLRLHAGQTTQQERAITENELP